MKMNISCEDVWRKSEDEEEFKVVVKMNMSYKDVVCIKNEVYE